MTPTTNLPRSVHTLHQKSNWLAADGSKKTLYKHIVFQVWDGYVVIRYFYDGKESQEWRLNGNNYSPNRQSTLDHARNEWLYLAARGWDPVQNFTL
jgi:hypothetical protein